MILTLALLSSCKKEEVVTLAPPRRIVRTADVRIVVADTSKSVDAVTKWAEAMGGSVPASQIWRDGELLRAKLTLRVPGDRMTATLATIRGLAKRVDNETVSSVEISGECVSLDSRARSSVSSP